MRYLTSFIIMAIMSIAGSVFAASDTWSGAVDTDWNTAGNWAGGSVPSGTADIATFTGAPAANQPALGSNRNLGQIRFETAGWTITGGDYNINFYGISTVGVHSSGAGVNIIDSNVSDQYIAGLIVQADAGNTLVFNKTPVNRYNWNTTGEGTIVFNNGLTSNTRAWTFSAGETYINSANFSCGSNSTITAGGTLGGTMPTLYLANYGTFIMEDGASLSPGGTGVYGDKISNMTIQCSGGNYSNFSLGGGNSSLIMDIGDTLGTNDRLTVNLGVRDINLAGATLALRADGAVEDGVYTLMTFTQGAYGYGTSSFGAVTLNGETLDPARYALNYYEDDRIDITLNGIVPEPTIMSLLGMGGLLLLRRKR